MVILMVKLTMHLPKWGRYWKTHPWLLTDHPLRPERFSEGDGFPNISPVLVQHVQYSAVHSLMILGMDQGIHSSRQISIDSVKINPSLPMIRECWIRSHLIYHIYYVICVHLIVWIIKLYLSCFALNSIRLNQSVPQLLTIIAVLPLFCLLVHHQAANQSHYCTKYTTLIDLTLCLEI